MKTVYKVTAWSNERQEGYDSEKLGIIYTSEEEAEAQQEVILKDWSTFTVWTRTREASALELLAKVSTEAGMPVTKVCLRTCYGESIRKLCDINTGWTIGKDAVNRVTKVWLSQSRCKGVWAGVDLKAMTEGDFTAIIENAQPKDHPYYKAVEAFRKLYNTHFSNCGASIYATSYGIGLWVFYNFAAKKNFELLSGFFTERGLAFENEYSPAGWVLRFKLSKSQDNVALIEKAFA